ncbi:protein dead ringer isoform X2 [Diprion similis]|uniref:protein dead ringer isoform X2 n=1 Tax=Diprion similis TaxID=362088 RepID=UPI001EF7A790|nr:protein dead ringer isoform X2 [Diprion similis]
MEISDEFQEMGNPGGGVAMANITMNHHHHTPDSPMSHQEEDLSDPDLQDEESGEELPQQPLQGNDHSSSATTPISNSTPTPLTHLNSLMNSHHPHFLAKLKMDVSISPESISSSNPSYSDERVSLLMSERSTNSRGTINQINTSLSRQQQQHQQHQQHQQQQQGDMDALSNKSGLEALQAAMGSGGFNLPFSFPPPAAFLAPPHHSQSQNFATGGTNNAITSSASSHSSESSQGSGRNGGESRCRTEDGHPQNNIGTNHQQQTSWSFEEQFKQVRQLYEINDDPKRKEFLDDLFSYMQKRGTPINRLPIMAKSVLDLYELYNLVIARGGLVDVINKKLWQEIIKGLHLPSSITSAAFTLRTQYMKYLYPYECEKRRLSTPAELQAAIDGNRREGRRSSYGAYAGGGGPGESMVRASPHTPSSLSLHAQMSPLSLVTAVAAGGQHHGPQSLVNGSAAHTPLAHHPHHPQHPQGPLGQPLNAGPIPGLAPSEIEARMVEYVKLLHKELRNSGAGTPPPMIHRQGSASPPSSTSPRDAALNALEMSRLTLWNMYNNNTLYPGVGHQPPLSPPAPHSPVPPATSPEPQREALDLGLRSSPMSSPPVRNSPPVSGGTPVQVKKDQDTGGITLGPTPAKRLLSEEDACAPDKAITTGLVGAHIKIDNRGGDGRSGENSLVVSMELNGVMYQGVLFAQTDNTTHGATATNKTKETKLMTF